MSFYGHYNLILSMYGATVNYWHNSVWLEPAYKECVLYFSQLWSPRRCEISETLCAKNGQNTSRPQSEIRSWAVFLSHLEGPAQSCISGTEWLPLSWWHTRAKVLHNWNCWSSQRLRYCASSTPPSSYCWTPNTSRWRPETNRSPEPPSTPSHTIQPVWKNLKTKSFTETNQQMNNTFNSSTHSSK